jgi:hypothetical protein
MVPRMGVDVREAQVLVRSECGGFGSIPNYETSCSFLYHTLGLVSHFDVFERIRDDSMGGRCM